MEKLAMLLMLGVCVVLMVGIFATFCLCMYIREFPKIKHNSKVDLGKNTYETQTEIDKTNVKMQ